MSTANIFQPIRQTPAKLSRIPTLVVKDSHSVHFVAGRCICRYWVEPCKRIHITGPMNLRLSVTGTNKHCSPRSLATQNALIKQPTFCGWKCSASACFFHYFPRQGKVQFVMTNFKVEQATMRWNILSCVIKKLSQNHSWNWALHTNTKWMLLSLVQLKND